VLKRKRGDGLPDPSQDFGIEPLDRLLNGGVQTGSVLSLTGPGGGGGSSIALRFLARGFEREQPGLFISFTSIPLGSIVREISSRRSLRPLVDSEEPLLLSTHDLSGLELVLGVLKEGAISRLVLDRPEVLGLRGYDKWFDKLEELLSKTREMRVATIVIEGERAEGLSGYLTDGTLCISKKGGRMRAELTRWPFAPAGSVEERGEGEWVP